MKKYIASILMLLILLLSISLAFHKNPQKDGLTYILTTITGSDTTYHLFSLFGMRRMAEHEIVDSVLTRYKRNELKDSMSIKFSQGEVLGISKVETFDNTTLIDFCAYEYRWKYDGVQTVPNKCEQE
jgi:hypothetical protein